VTDPRPKKRRRIDADVEQLLRQLHQDPEDLGVMAELRTRMLARGQAKGLVKVLVWWSRHRQTPEASVDALVEAAELRSGTLEDPAGALELLRGALDKVPTHGKAALMAEALAAETGDSRALLEVLLLRAEGQPSGTVRAELLRRAALLQRDRLHEPEAALAALERALADTPEDPALLVEVSDTYALAPGPAAFGRVADARLRLAALRGGLAIDHLLRTLRERPSHLPTLEVLEELAPRHGRDAELHEAWARFVEVDGDSPAGRIRHQRLARVRGGAPEEARDPTERTVSALPGAMGAAPGAASLPPGLFEEPSEAPRSAPPGLFEEPSEPPRSAPPGLSAGALDDDVDALFVDGFEHFDDDVPTKIRKADAVLLDALSQDDPRAGASPPEADGDEEADARPTPVHPAPTEPERALAPTPVAPVAETPIRPRAARPPAPTRASFRWDEEENVRLAPDALGPFDVPLARLGGGPPDGPLVVELFSRRGATVVGHRSLTVPGAGAKVRGSGVRVRLGMRAAKVRVPEGATVEVVRAGEAASEAPEGARLELGRGDVAELRHGAFVHRVRVVGAPPPIAVQGEPFPWTLYGASAGIALAVHLLAALVFALLPAAGVNLTVQAAPDLRETFAEARIDPPPDEPPPPPPERLQRLRARRPPPPVEERRPEVPVPQSLQRELARIAGNRRGNPNASAAERVAQALSGSAMGGDALSVTDAVTNIDAVEGPGNVAATTQIGGILQATGSGDVQVARGPAGDVQTTGGRQAAAGTERLQRRAGSGGGRVRGRVRASSALSRVSGSLSRSEVLQVINRSQGRIQACYERGLTRRASLAGRVTFSWTIQPNGRVAGAREQASTLGDPAVSSCILGVIRGMRFPQPSGGPVQVTFPFLFQRAP
jgi:hypothetical protein